MEAIASPAPSTAAAHRQRFWMMMAICAGAFISHFTAGIVNVSLPRFTQLFDADLGIVQWITTGYLLVIVSVLPVMGRLGDRYGYRTIHNWGYVVFTVSSVLIALSPDIYTLLALRVVQALGTAMFQATNIALIATHIPGENRGRALGIMSTAVALGGMSGPFAGGLIAQWLSWHWLFLIHVPVAIAATWLAIRFIPPGGEVKRTGDLDRVGAILFMAAMTLWIWGLTEGNAWGWGSASLLTVFAVAAAASVTLLLWETRQSHPFLPIKAMAIPAVSVGLAVSCISFILANAVLVVVPFYLAGRSGFSPASVGLVMTSYPLLLAVAGPVAGYWSDRSGSKRLVLGGLGAMGAGLLILAIYIERMHTIPIVAVLALIGMGMGFVASTNNSYIMQRVPKPHVGSIGGMIALTRNAGMVLGAALGLGVLNGGMGQEAADLGDFRAVFAIGVLICAFGMTLLLCGDRVGKRRRSP